MAASLSYLVQRARSVASPNRSQSLGYFLILPTFVFLLIFLGYPFVYAIYLSLTDKQLGIAPTFIGLQNFFTLADNTLYWKTVRNSLVYTALALMFKLIFGIGLALFLNRQFHGRRLVQAALLLPWIIPSVFSTLSWWWILDPAFSIVNVVLRDAGIINASLPFLVDPNWAMGSLILVNVWRGVPFFAITSLAAIQAISSEVIEAATMDGVSGWQRFWYIILPQIMPVLLIVILITTIGNLSEFELPYLLTRGGPNDGTSVFGILTYLYSMSDGQIGLGSAVSLTMFPILALLVIWSLVRLQKAN